MTNRAVKKQAGVPRWRRYAPLFFPSYLALALITMVALGLAARRKPYFALDLKTTRALQAYRPAWFDRFMRSISWLGYPPPMNILGSALILFLFALGLKWEAATELIITTGGTALFYATVWLVKRPRPSADLVQVALKIPLAGFPSGHVLNLTAGLGFVWFLVYTSRLPHRLRTLLLPPLSAIILLIGPARV